MTKEIAKVGSRNRDRRLGFVGVTATASSINQVFPAWAAELGLADVRLDPVDLALDTAPERYREVVAEIIADPEHQGALVTSHKVRLLRAAADMFDDLDPLADLTGEISCISKRDGRLRGHAKDPITAGRSLAEFVPAGHFADGADVLCIGAGGSGLAISLYLLTRPAPADRPRRLTLVNRAPDRLAECKAIHDRLDAPSPRPEVRYITNADPPVNDDLLTELPSGSLVIHSHAPRSCNERTDHRRCGVHWIPSRRSPVVRGDTVLVIDNYATGRRDNLVSRDRLSIVEGTIADRILVDGLFRKFRPDVVIHAAASYKDPTNWGEDSLTNVVGTVNVVQAAKGVGIRRLIYFETALC
jgi:shikimate 5-dehydrogenase